MVDAGPQLHALADPTRRTIFELVRRAPSSVRELTDQVAISQPAVSQHLKVLRGARLVVAEPRGARTIYAVDRAGLLALRSWLDAMWDDVLDAFVDAATDLAAERARDDPSTEERP